MNVKEKLARGGCNCNFTLECSADGAGAPVAGRGKCRGDRSSLLASDNGTCTGPWCHRLPQYMPLASWYGAASRRVAATSEPNNTLPLRRREGPTPGALVRWVAVFPRRLAGCSWGLAAVEGDALCHIG